MRDVSMRIWGREVRLRDFPDAELAEVRDNFAGSLTEVDGAAPELTVVRTYDGATASGTVVRPRHRGGSSARKYFLDGTPFDGGEQHRDIEVVAEGPTTGAYTWEATLVVVDADTVRIDAAGPASPMLLCDVIEDWLLCASRRTGAVQVHCAGWLDDGVATLVIGSSGVGKTTELFRRLQGGSSFLSNDRAFLRVRDGRVEVRSFPLPVNVGCGTIRSLELDLPHHDLGDHDKIRLRAPEVAQRYGADYDSWWPVDRIVCRSLTDLRANVYWDEDDCHPFWIRPWHPGPLPATTVDQLTAALDALITATVLLP
jgi:hypothetical protein